MIHIKFEWNYQIVWFKCSLNSGAITAKKLYYTIDENIIGFTKI